MRDRSDEDAALPPPAHVLDLFVAQGLLEPLAGGRGTSWRAGDLVLSPGRDATQFAWLAFVQARLAVQLDEEVPHSIRLALPVPARDGRLVVDGWAATRFEPGTTTCRDVATLRATAHLLHEPGLRELVVALVAGLDDTDLGREQLVHADLAGSVLLDGAGTPFVVDLSPAWRSPLWAEAVCVLAAVAWYDPRMPDVGRKG